MANIKLETQACSAQPLIPAKLESSEINDRKESNNDTSLKLIDKFQRKTKNTKNTKKLDYEYLGKIQDKEVLEAKDFLKQVKKVAKTKIQNREFEIGSVASQFNMSIRTFQRHLGKNDTSYRSIVSQIRKQLAEKYVCQGNYSCQGTAVKLGFSEPATFIRNFRRWFNCTPGEYRKKFKKSAPPPSKRKIGTKHV